MEEVLKKQTDLQEEAMKAALKYIRDHHPAASVIDRSHILQAYVEGYLKVAGQK